MLPIDAQVKRSYYTRLIVMGVLTLGIGFLLMGWEYRHWVQRLDELGALRRDGRRFAWDALEQVKCVRYPRETAGRRPLNHVELVFANGTVKIFPLMLENGIEILRYVRTLPSGDALAEFGF